MNIINETVVQYLDSLYKPLNEPLARLRQVSEAGGVPVILKETEGLLIQLLKLARPRTILEIGTATGYSAALFAFVCPEARVLSVENREKSYLRAKKNMEELGLSDRVSLFLGDGVRVLRSLAPPAPVDFFFIDAAKSHYNAFFEEGLRHCAPGALIVSDNVLMHAMTASEAYDPRGRHKTSIREMREYLRGLTEREDAETCFLASGDGLAVTRFLGKGEAFRFPAGAGGAAAEAAVSCRRREFI